MYLFIYYIYLLYLLIIFINYIYKLYMDKFLKYLILFLIGIILYYILNKQERFSIGIPTDMELEDIIAEIQEINFRLKEGNFFTNFLSNVLSIF